MKPNSLPLSSSTAHTCHVGKDKVLNGKNIQDEEKTKKKMEKSSGEGMMREYQCCQTDFVTFRLGRVRADFFKQNLGLIEPFSKTLRSQFF